MNTILDCLAKIKAFWDTLDIRDIAVICIIILAILASYGLGKASNRAYEHQGVVINLIEPQEEEMTSEAPVIQEKRYVGSRNGSKYHLPWCSGAQRIKEENKVWFGSKVEAENRGYVPAKNCEGI